MNVIELNSYPVHFRDTFLIILPSKSSYELYVPFHFVEWSNKEYLGCKYLISKETIQLKEVTDAQSYLAKNCDAKLFYQIIKTQYKRRLSEADANYQNRVLGEDKFKTGELFTHINKETLVDVLVFTSKENIRELNKVAPFEYDNKESMLSKKPVLSKDYCHKSKWNFEQQRPYSEDELKTIM
jgi:hypothetical protein